MLCSFQSFFIETLMLANRDIDARGWPKNAPNYTVTLAAFFNLFRRFRACEILYIKGYPLDGYALMRDIKDRALWMAGVARNITTFENILGLPVGDPSKPDACGKEHTRNRKYNEHRVMHAMTGKTSGLQGDVQDDLKRWDDMFHLEMHGGIYSLIQELGELQKGKMPQIGPSVVQDASIMYVNRSSELGWMVTRLLPYLHMTEHAFGGDWHEKRDILDDSFRYGIEGLSNFGTWPSVQAALAPAATMHPPDWGSSGVRCRPSEDLQVQNNPAILVSACKYSEERSLQEVQAQVGHAHFVKVPISD